jgi:hypothetical protein
MLEWVAIIADSHNVTAGCYYPETAWDEQALSQAIGSFVVTTRVVGTAKVSEKVTSMKNREQEKAKATGRRKGRGSSHGRSCGGKQGGRA